MLHQLGTEDSATDNYRLIHPAIVPAGSRNVYSEKMVIRSRLMLGISIATLYRRLGGEDKEP
jgi:hypothetical protein